jgi:hypothetical protein
MSSILRLTAAIAGLSLVPAFACAAVPSISSINSYYTTAVATDSLDSASSWTVIQSAANGSAAIDASATFGFDYAAGGTFGATGGTITLAAGVIPAAPSGTSTRGLVMTAQDVDDAGTDATQAIAARLSSAVSLPPTQTSYVVRFDMWGNFISGTGSSEFAYFGVGANSTQTSIGALATGATGTSPATATSGTGPFTSGQTFAVCSDGGFARDYRAFAGATEDVDASNVGFFATHITSPTFGPAQESAHPYYGTAVPPPPGNKWLDVVIYSDGTDTVWYLNGLPIYKRAAVPLNQAFLGYMDMNSSVSAPSLQTFVVFDNFRVLIPEPTSLGLLAGAGMLALRRRK